MAKNLLIVESPAKAKTIEKILGKDFEVRSCFGHIRDLEKGDNAIDVKNGYKPHYVVPEGKEKVVAELKKMAKSSQEIWLASDEDREGESISWHLAELLGLDPQSTKRIVFHEITPPAIKYAVDHPRKIDLNLVYAQQARRILDRLVGFELSPVLWRKIGMQKSLSAGRVQSVAVRMITDREREINQFASISSFKIEAIFKALDKNENPIQFKAEGNSKLDTETAAQGFLNRCKEAVYTVENIEVKPSKRTPAPPFTTSTLQQEASRKLGYGVTKTMLLAQKLYESGKITYMRTDSINLSDTAMNAIEATVCTSFGNKYYQKRKYKNKNQAAQEAHEAIRPTYMEHSTIADPETKRLYELIWKRTMASQMADAQLEKTVALIHISTQPTEKLTATGEVLIFDGFLKLYMEGKDDDEEGDGEKRLPPLKKGQILPLVEMKATEKFSRPLPRYTEASLVKKMEDLGIGRPSTYAPTITTIMKRNYVEKKDKEGVQRSYTVLQLLPNNTTKKAVLQETVGAEKSKLFPTDLGFIVTDFLIQYFQQIMDYNFTARIEEEFDEIAEGSVTWQKMIDAFYQPFHKNIEHTLETAERATGSRVLGFEPNTKNQIIARMGKYGPMVEILPANKTENSRFAGLSSTQSIETISLSEALALFALPRHLGEWEGLPLSVNIGRFGPYAKWGESFISIPKTEDLSSIDQARAIELIKAKQAGDAPVGFYDNLPITKGKGRFGPFIKWNGIFINVPRKYDFEGLTQENMDELIALKITKEANRFIQEWKAEKISIENGRWGAFIRFKTKMLKIDKKSDGTKYSPEELTTMPLETVKKMIETQVPNAFNAKADKAKTTKKSKPKTLSPRKPAKK